jgi:hypothetical protein
MMLLPHKFKFGLAMVLLFALNGNKNRLSSLPDLASMIPQEILLIFCRKVSFHANGAGVFQLFGGLQNIRRFSREEEILTRNPSLNENIIRILNFVSCSVSIALTMAYHVELVVDSVSI